MSEQSAEKDAGIQQLPTLPGKVDGIVGWDPLVLQCRECGTTHVGDRYNVAAEIILSGFHFHSCVPGSGRRCPPCLSAVESSCPNTGKHGR